MKYTKLLPLVFAALMLIGCGSSKTTTTTGTTPPPLDPQGNWLFIVTGDTSSVNFAGQLYELTEPTVTSNPMAALTNQGICSGSFNVSGQASGVATINLTVTEVNSQAPAVVSLTGTIADSQAAMSGTWTTTQPGTCLAGDSSGTWSAQLLQPVTGNWTGTLNGTSGDLTATLGLTENTDQTSPNMGQVTGTIAITGSPCFDPSVPLNLPGWTDGGSSSHGGETLTLATAADTNGATTQGSGTVDTTAATYTLNSYQINGGACNGQTFTGTFTKQ